MAVARWRTNQNEISALWPTKLRAPLAESGDDAVGKIESRKGVAKDERIKPTPTKKRAEGHEQARTEAVESESNHAAQAMA